MWSTQIWMRKLDVWPVPQTIGAPGAAGPGGETWHSGKSPRCPKEQGS